MSREPFSELHSEQLVEQASLHAGTESVIAVWPMWLDGLAWLYATGAGVGLCPKAPGTAGSVWGPLLVCGWQWFDRPLHESVALTLVCIAIGVAAAGRVASKQRCEDPGFVVCDEIVAFAIVFAGVNVSWLTGLIGFVWFRVFDIAKPWPISRLERLPGGWGIMADDLLAGAFAAAALRGTLWLLEFVV
ncbi:MAG: phosphatidylglycerophosphatase A [Planctomycetia bacterium]|nr:phosphatidylglycerophosphatase A [Planctomycetia bacterium]